MSYLKIVEELFLGKIELERFQEFMKDSGFQKFISKIGTEFGLLDSLTNSFENGLVEQDLGATIKIKEIFGIDKDGLFLSRSAITNIPVPQDSTWYWIKAYHSYNTRESGKVSIGADGTLTGVGTEFLKIFRGQPDFPTKIIFYNSINNLLEYEVLEVISDTVASLQGIFIAETDLEFSIIGTFTEGYIPPTINKYPLQYDYCTYEFVASDLMPTYVLGKEFFLARVKWDVATSTLFVEDKRSTFRFKLQSDYYLNQRPLTANPLIGIEEIKWDATTSTKDKNRLYFAWTLRTSNYTFNPNTNKLIITNGKGGRFKDSTFATNFTDGDFNGWRVYPAGGTEYFKILSSIKNLTTIELILMNGDATYLSGSDELIIAPPAEEIEIICSVDSSYGTEISNQKFLFPINLGIGKIDLLVLSTNPTLYNIRYRYKSHNNYSQIYNLLSDTIGYYAENQHYSNGELIEGAVQTPYVAISYNPPNPDGFIPLTLALTAYSIFNLGDIPGLTTIILDGPPPVTQPYKLDLEVGLNKKYQLLIASYPWSLTANLIINLISNSSNKNGNEFNICFVGNIILNGFKIEIRENYVDIITPGTLIKLIPTQAELTFRQNPLHDLLWLKFIFNGTAWFKMEEDNFGRVYANKLAIDANTAAIALINTTRSSNSILSTWLTCDAGATATVVTGTIVTKKIDAKTVFVTIDLGVTIVGGPPTTISVDLLNNLSSIFTSGLLHFNTTGYCMSTDFCTVLVTTTGITFTANGGTVINFGAATHVGWSGVVFLT
jgi:hypothetical protein